MNSEFFWWVLYKNYDIKTAQMKRIFNEASAAAASRSAIKLQEEHEETVFYWWRSIIVIWWQLQMSWICDTAHAQEACGLEK